MGMVMVATPKARSGSRLLLPAPPQPAERPRPGSLTAAVVLGQTRSFTVALIALFLVGAGDMVSVYIRHILVQFETPDSIRGRVSAVNAVFIGASNELGEFESGLTASWFGLLPAILLGGSATLVVAALWALGFPVLSRMDRFPHAKRDPEQSADGGGTAEAAATT
ncbi:hypothetical protein WME97_05555 [Sorangium sp. So ce367]